MIPVILLHGLGLTRRSRQPLAGKLAARGFQTLNLDYPSRKFSLETLAGYVWADIQTTSGSSPPPLNFVTHSMGGIVVRVLARGFPVQIHRAVMLAPPNQGSEWADVLPLAWLRFVMGDHLTLPYAHFYLRYMPDVLQKTIRFLETGSFQKG